MRIYQISFSMYKNLSSLLVALVIVFIVSSVAFSNNSSDLIGVTPAVERYAFNVVKPVLDVQEKRDILNLLLKVSEIITDPEKGVHVNAVEPSKFIIYDKLESVNLGFLYIFNLSDLKKRIVKDWRIRFMGKNPADVFFAPSADDVVRTKAAFGCSHYARVFMAVVKSLGLVTDPKDMRYVVSAKSDNFNKALEGNDKEKTINGHQFVIVRIDGKWIAINTSKSEWVDLPEGFEPGAVVPPKNISVKFPSYPGVTFLLRKIGKDFNDDCGDGTLNSLMNIYRSGSVDNSDFLWEKFGN